MSGDQTPDNYWIFSGYYMHYECLKKALSEIHRLILIFCLPYVSLKIKNNTGSN